MQKRVMICLMMLALLSARNSAFSQSQQISKVIPNENANAPESQRDILFVNFPAKGWYIVSLPLTVADSSVSTLFPTATGAFAFGRNGYVQATTMKPGQGYWLNISAPSVAVISGTPVTRFSGHFQSGWHLIGSLPDTVDFSNPQDTPDGAVSLPIYGWNAGYFPTTTIAQSFGYWMRVVQDCDLVVAKGSATIAGKTGKAFTNEAFDQQFGAAPPPPPFALAAKPTEAPPTRSSLSSNYPNPFNPETMIRYTLSQNGRARIAIYNNLGQRIRVLSDQEQQAGVYEVRWDGRDDQGRLVGSGVYFYQITINGFAETKKMVLRQ
jgi:hypothetical protein